MGASMPGWYESVVDRQIREARERGDFDDLPGAGKPLPGFGEAYDEDWWLKDLIRREHLTGMLPPTLALRKEVEDVAETVAAKKRESAVREYLADLNRRIGNAQRGLLDGPPVTIPTLDVETVVRAWRRRRAGS
jgi:hypothetical protein